MKKDNPCPYLWQFENERFPGGTCNVTSLAMVMQAYGIKGPSMGFKRLPDNLSAYMESKGLDRHSLVDLDKVAETFGLIDDSSYTTSFAKIKAHLKAGGLVIVHGNFTASGHIIVVRGIDEEKGLWQCNDPAGKWTPWGYPGVKDGEGVWYGSDWFRSKAAPDGVVWAHLLGKKK